MKITKVLRLYDSSELKGLILRRIEIFHENPYDPESEMVFRVFMSDYLNRFSKDDNLILYLTLGSHRYIVSGTIIKQDIDVYCAPGQAMYDLVLYGREADEKTREYIQQRKFQKT